MGSSHNSRVWVLQWILKIKGERKRDQAKVLDVTAFLEEHKHLNEDLESQKRTTSFMQSSRKPWVEKCKRQIKLNQIQVSLDFSQKNTAEQALPSRSPSKNSAGTNGTINGTPKLKRKHKKRHELRKELLLKDPQIYLARFVTAFLDRILSFAHIFSTLGVSILLEKNSIHRRLEVQCRS